MQPLPLLLSLVPPQAKKLARAAATLIRNELDSFREANAALKADVARLYSRLDEDIAQYDETMAKLGQMQDKYAALLQETANQTTQIQQLKARVAELTVEPTLTHITPDMVKVRSHLIVAIKDYRHMSQCSLYDSKEAVQKFIASNEATIVVPVRDKLYKAEVLVNA